MLIASSVSASRSRGVVVDLVLIAEGGKGGDVGRFGKGLQGGAALGRPVAAAQQDQRALRGLQQVKRLIQRAGRGFVDRDRAGQGRGVGEGGQHILGKRNDHGAGAARQGDGPGAGQKLGDAEGAVDLDHPFRHRAEDGGVVQFLKRLAALHVGADLADEQDHRRRILHRGMDADGGIGGTGATGDHADPRLAGQLAPGGGHEGGPALVPAEHIVKPSGCVMQRVKHGQIAFSRHAEGLPRPQSKKAFHQKLPAALHVSRLVCLHRGHHALLPAGTKGAGSDATAQASA